VWSRLISEYGYQVTTLTNSFEALDLFIEDPYQFDLVITDQTMPDLSGKELIEKFLCTRPDLPTILCTGYSTKIDAIEAEKLGISAFCLKPLNLSELMQTINRVLTNR